MKLVKVCNEELLKRPRIFLTSWFVDEERISLYLYYKFILLVT